jgi:predicted permease
MVFHEIRYAVRSLVRVPSLTAISILTVALGVGTGTALFSVVKAVLLNPLPYADPGRLAWLAEINDHGGPMQVGFQNFLDWQAANRTFSAMGAYEEGPAIVSGGDLPRSTVGAAVTEDFFRVLRTDAIVGRTFSHEEQVAGGPLAVVIGYGLWQRAFGGDRSILGRSIHLLGMAPVVVGIMPTGFSYPEKAELWVPGTAFGDPGLGVRTGHNWRVVGRLKPGVGMEQAQADIGAIERGIKQQYPSPFQGKDAEVVSLAAHVTGEVRRPLLMLFGAVGFLLLIVCVNVANLLLVRVASRARELAVRTALGAGRSHLIRQMLTESLLLAVAGGTCGVLLGAWSMELLRVMLPADLPRGGEISIDAGVIAFAVAISAAAGLVFGVLPAWRASAGLNVNDALKAGSRSATAGKRSQRIQAALAISEASLSLVLVVGAGLLLRSFWNLRSIDPGFRPDRVLAADTNFERQGDESLIPEYRDLLARARAIPGVEAAAMTRSLPVESGAPDGHFFIGDRRAETGNADANYSVITPGYLKAFRIPLLRGRDFTDQDTERSQPVAIVSSGMARVYFADRDPMGQRIWFDSFNSKEHWLTIVGIAGDIHEDGLTVPVFPQAYTCYTQQESGGMLNGGTLVLRTVVEPASVAGAVRTAIRAVNPAAVPGTRTMDSVLAGSLAKQRFQMQILGGFAVLALLLAAVGLYGVLSHMVTVNRAQIGIRLALGAPRSLVFRMVAGRALALTGIGVIAGALGCLALRSVLAAVVFGIGPNDAATLAGAIAVLLAVALAAAWLPARRAAGVDPMAALRED